MFFVDLSDRLDFNEFCVCLDKLLNLRILYELVEINYEFKQLVFF
jgi:hypothetical protein